MPQEFNFDDYFTVDEILRFYAGYFGIRRSEARKRVDELLDQFNLGEKRETHVRQLSGGMKRRLLIARALVHNPRILILDGGRFSRSVRSQEAEKLPLPHLHGEVV